MTSTLRRGIAYLDALQDWHKKTYIVAMALRFREFKRHKVDTVSTMKPNQYRRLCENVWTESIRKRPLLFIAQLEKKRQQPAALQLNGLKAVCFK